MQDVDIFRLSTIATLPLPTTATARPSCGRAPRLFIVASLRMGEPGLNVFPRGAVVITGRQEILVHRTLPSLRSDALAGGLLQDLC